MMRDPVQTIGNLIDRAGVSYIGSVDGEGFPEMKAMLPPRRREGVRELWFTSNTSSMRAAHYRENPKACAYFCDRRFFRGVMLKGHMEVLTSPEIKAEIWRGGGRAVLSRRGGRSRLLRPALHRVFGAVLQQLPFGGLPRGGVKKAPGR